MIDVLDFASAKTMFTTLSLWAWLKKRQKFKGEKMTTDDKAEIVAKAADDVKKDGLAMLKATGLEVLGALMLAGASWLFIKETLFNGNTPNFLVIGLLAVPGLILLIIGSFWLLKIKFREWDRDSEKLKKRLA